MKPWMNKTLAVIEVIGVAVLFVPLITLGVYGLLPQFERWQTETLGFRFPVFVDVVMVVVVLLVLLLRRKKPTEYGLNFTNLKYHLDIAGACFIPFVLANFPFALGVDHTSWDGALILAGVQVGLLFVLGWILRKKPSADSLVILAAGMLVFRTQGGGTGGTVGQAVAVFLTYALFVGFGEEILYRGYVQSRLNEVFGKPFRFFGVAYGWGGIFAAMIFGFTHTGILSGLLNLSSEVTLAWGFWTVFSGLVFGFVREKSGSILAPALLHGLPQAIAEVVILFI
jgi:uncharacterized protein